MDMMTIIDIHVVLIWQQTIVTISLRKTLVFVVLIMLLKQQMDLYLHFCVRFQKNRT